MERTYWYKQTIDKPLFPDLIWGRPETRHTAGKLLIIGGNIHGFAAPALAFNEAVKAGAGTLRVLLPDVLQKTVGKLMPEANFTPSTPSGSLSQSALEEWLEHSAWADGVLIAGDLGRNSETAILLERYAAKSDALLTLTKDAVDYFTNLPAPILDRPNTTAVLSIAQLQKLALAARFKTTFTFSMDFLHLVGVLHEFTRQFSLNVIVKHLNTIFVAVQGKVSSTPATGEQEFWRVPIAAHAAVWWLQNSARTFEALTTAIREEQ